MNIIIDSFNDAIRIFRAPSKKVPCFDFSMPFDFALSSKENQAKALVELLKTEEGAELLKEKDNSLLITDDGIGFGLFEIPAMSHSRQRDIFDTRFKSWFPNFDDYHVRNYEYERAQKTSKYFYTLCRKDTVDLLVNVLKSAGVKVSNVNYFASLYVSTFEKKNAYPIATLVVGKWDSELIISKGDSVLSIACIGYGEKLLNKGEEYLHSAYFKNDDSAAKFAAYAKGNFATRAPFTDENIIRADAAEGISFPAPKELRLLKGDSLVNYNIRNNYRRFVCLISDVFAAYSSAPWFLPLNEVKTISSPEVLAHLQEAAKEEEGLEFTNCDNDLEKVYTSAFGPEKLFSSTIKKGRKRIQWSKFFTMEIGKRKKP